MSPRPLSPLRGEREDVVEAPAPWQLRGRAYIAMLRCPADLLDEGSFVPASLRGKRRPSPYGYLMFVDYASSPVGPYHELLFIPGAFRFEDGRDHWSISRIFVSSQASVVNGNRNWGIPKDLAQFDVRYGRDGVDRVSVAQDGKVFARLAFRRYRLGVPLRPWMTPARWRTLAQHDHGRTYVYTPVVSAWAQVARWLEGEFDGAVFPDLAGTRPVVCVHLPDFRMTFPPARILAR